MQLVKKSWEPEVRYYIDNSRPIDHIYAKPEKKNLHIITDCCRIFKVRRSSDSLLNHRPHNKHPIMVRIIQGAPLRKRFHIPRLQNVQTAHETHPLSYPTGTWILLRGVKRPGRDVNHALPLRVDVKNEWSHTFAPPICLHGVGKENFTFFTFIFTASKSWQFAYES